MSSVEINKPIVIKEFESSYPLSLAKEDVDYIRNIVQEGDEKKIDLIQRDDKYIIKAKNFVGTIPLKYSTYPRLIINPKAGQLNFFQMWGFTGNIKTAKLFDTVDISEGDSLADLIAAARAAKALLSSYLIQEKFPLGSDCDEVMQKLNGALEPYKSM